MIIITGKVCSVDGCYRRHRLYGAQTARNTTATTSLNRITGAFRPAHSTEMITEAYGYARKGWPVLPLDGKRPRTPRGHLDATKDTVVIERWWRHWPDANIGARVEQRQQCIDVLLINERLSPVSGRRSLLLRRIEPPVLKEITVVVFGTRVGREEEPVDLASIPTQDRRAEIRCRKNHLMGVVTRDEIVTGGVVHPLLGATGTILTYCRRCSRTSPDYDLDRELLRRALDQNPRRRRLRIKVADVARVRPVPGPRG
jgi:hypothetical protein